MSILEVMLPGHGPYHRLIYLVDRGSGFKVLGLQVDKFPHPKSGDPEEQIDQAKKRARRLYGGPPDVIFNHVIEGSQVHVYRPAYPQEIKKVSEAYKGKHK